MALLAVKMNLFPEELYIRKGGRGKVKDMFMIFYFLPERSSQTCHYDHLNLVFSLGVGCLRLGCVIKNSICIIYCFPHSPLFPYQCCAGVGRV